MDSPGREKVAKWKSEVNQSEAFMVKDGWYESEKWIMPEAAIYLYNSIDPQPARLPIPQETFSLILFSWSLPNLIWKTKCLETKRGSLETTQGVLGVAVQFSLIGKL